MTIQSRLRITVALIAVLAACQKSGKPAVSPQTSRTAMIGPASPAPPAENDQSTEDQDCVRSSLGPLLIMPDGSANPTFRKLGEHEAQEQASLDDDTSVVIRQFGCVDSSVEFSFSLPHESASQRNPDDWLRRAAELLGKLKIAEEQEETVQEIADNLKESAEEPYNLGDALPLSEMDSVSVTVEPATSGVKLVVHYEITF